MDVEAYIDGLRVGLLVPRRVQVSDPGRNVGPDAVLGRYVRGILVDTVVDCVNRLDEFLRPVQHPAERKCNDVTDPVQLQPKDFDARIVHSRLEQTGNDLLAKVPTRLVRLVGWWRVRMYSLVDQASRGKLCVEAMSKDLGEPTLVVVEALLSLIVHAADIDDNSASVQNSGVSGTLQICVKPLVECESADSIFFTDQLQRTPG